MSQPIIVNCLAEPYTPIFGTNSTSSSFASIVPRVTPPTGAGIRELETNGTARRWANIIFYGAGSGTFAAKVIGWQKTEASNSTGLWIPTVLLPSTTFTLGSVTGVAGYDVADTDKFATASITETTLIVPSDATDGIQTVRVGLFGFSKLQIAFDMTGATSANALVSTF